MIWSFFKGNQAPDPIQALAQQARAQGTEAAQAWRAMKSIGLDINPKMDKSQFCINATVAIVTAIAKNAKQLPIKKKSDKRFIAGLFAFVVADCLSYRIGERFEFISSIAAINLMSDLFDPDKAAEDVHAVADLYNELARSGATIELIGQTFTNWLVAPDAENHARLVGVYVMLVEKMDSK